VAHDAINELTAAYALDALDRAETDAYEEHLAGCETCRDELAGFSAVAGSLALAAPPVDPSERLRSRILDAARAERPNVVPLRTRPSRANRVFAAVAAVAACVAIGLGIWNVSLHNQLDTAQQSALRSASLTGATGSVVVGPSGKGVLVMTDLPAAPTGKTYEAWVIDQGAATRAGTFDGGRTVAVPLEEKVPSGAIVAVTVEDEGGVDQPTQQPFVTSAPVV